MLSPSVVVAGSLEPGGAVSGGDCVHGGPESVQKHCDKQHRPGPVSAGSAPLWSGDLASNPALLPLFQW